MNARTRLMFFFHKSLFSLINRSYYISRVRRENTHDIKNKFYFKKITFRFLPWKIKGIMTYKLIDSIVGEGKIKFSILARLNFVSQVFQKQIAGQ